MQRQATGCSAPSLPAAWLEGRLSPLVSLRQLSSILPLVIRTKACLRIHGAGPPRLCCISGLLQQPPPYSLQRISHVLLCLPADTKK